MKYEIINLEEKILVGVSAVTGNDDPEMGKVIGGLWQSLYSEGISAKIKNKANEYAVGLYSDYNENQYTVTVGNVVSKLQNEELSTKIIPAGKYAKFTIEGDVVEAVRQAWIEIWNMNLDRSYKADFEEYLNSDMNNAKINIYISLN